MEALGRVEQRHRVERFAQCCSSFCRTCQKDFSKLFIEEHSVDELILFRILLQVRKVRRHKSHLLFIIRHTYCKWIPWYIPSATSGFSLLSFVSGLFLDLVRQCGCTYRPIWTPHPFILTLTNLECENKKKSTFFHLCFPVQCLTNDRTYSRASGRSSRFGYLELMWYKWLKKLLYHFARVGQLSIFIPYENIVGLIDAFTTTHFPPLLPQRLLDMPEVPLCLDVLQLGILSQSLIHHWIRIRHAHSNKYRLEFINTVSSAKPYFCTLLVQFVAILHTPGY